MGVKMMRLLARILAALSLTVLIVASALGITYTTAQWGVDRTSTPWTICIYDANKVCQPIFSMDPTSGAVSFFGSINLAQMGGDPTGIKDVCVSAWPKAIAAVPAVGGEIYVPPGRFAAGCQFAVANKNIVIRGNGSVSQLYFTSAAVNSQGINFSSTDETKALEVKDLSISTAVDQPNGTAIFCGVTTPILGYTRTCLVNNVMIGSGDRVFPFRHYWNIGIYLKNVSMSQIYDVQIFGAAANGTVAGQPITSSNMLNAIKIESTGSTVPASGNKMDKLFLFLAQTAIQVDGHAEQPFLTHSEILNSNKGYVQNADGACGVITDNDFSIAQTAIELNNCFTGTVANNLIPVAGGSGSGYDIKVTNGQNLNIHDNILYLGSSGYSISYGLDIDAASYGNKISNNMCVNVGVCFNTNGSTLSTGTNVFTTNTATGVAYYDINPSRNAIYLGSIGLPVVEQFPQLALNSATPNASFPSKVVATHATSALSITSFPSAAWQGPEWTLYCNDTNTTLVHSANLLLKGGVNHVCVVGDTLRFAPIGNGIMRQIN